MTPRFERDATSTSATVAASALATTAISTSGLGRRDRHRRPVHGDAEQSHQGCETARHVRLRFGWGCSARRRRISRNGRACRATAPARCARRRGGRPADGTQATTRPPPPAAIPRRRPASARRAAGLEHEGLQQVRAARREREPERDAEAHGPERLGQEQPREARAGRTERGANPQFPRAERRQRIREHVGAQGGEEQRHDPEDAEDRGSEMLRPHLSFDGSRSVPNPGGITAGSILAGHLQELALHRIAVAVDPQRERAVGRCFALGEIEVQRQRLQRLDVDDHVRHDADDGHVRRTARPETSSARSRAARFRGFPPASWRASDALAMPTSGARAPSDATKPRPDDSGSRRVTK